MLSFIWRNPATFLTPRKTAATIAAMRQYARDYPVCRWCGKTGVEVHHIKPVQYAPQLASDPANMISLCRRCHLVVGHLGSFKRACSNVRVVCLLKEENAL